MFLSEVRIRKTNLTILLIKLILHGCDANKILALTIKRRRRSASSFLTHSHTIPLFLIVDLERARSLFCVPPPSEGPGVLSSTGGSPPPPPPPPSTPPLRGSRPCGPPLGVGGGGVGWRVLALSLGGAPGGPSVPGCTGGGPLKLPSPRKQPSTGARRDLPPHPLRYYCGEMLGATMVCVPPLRCVYMQ